MPAVGFEDDVTFAKSLFSERIIQIYQQHKYYCGHAAQNMSYFWHKIR